MLSGLFKKKNNKVVVLGLDGVPCSLLERFTREGIMPNLARMMENGTLSRMNASIPEVSSTSWSTFMTGNNPGKHGIYGFMELDRATYSWKFPNFNDLNCKTIWEIAGENGKRSIVLNIPSTYPARPLNGMMVSGFVALDLKKAAYPESFYNYLDAWAYRLDVDARKATSAMKDFKEDIVRTFRKRIEVIHHLFERENWDLFIAAITETDRLHHYLWAAMEDNTHSSHGFFINFYRELDGFIGALYDRIGSDVPFIILSDHGFTSIKKEVYLNTYLREMGYLKFNKPDPGSFEDMEGDSQAFVLDPSRVYIHRRDKFSRGCVDESQYGEIREKVKSDLLALEVNGVKVIRKAYFHEDLYKGSCLENAPDIVLLPHDGFDLKGSPAKKELTGNSHLTGGHTRENATFFINRNMNYPGIINIADVGATVLHMMGLPAGDLDGMNILREN